MRLLLASASPRRAELLAQAGFEFETRPTDVDESPLSGETPADYALRVARAKALRVALDGPDAPRVVLAADTVVIARNAMMGKPVDQPDARRMLVELSGRVHEVLTAVVLRTADREASEVVSTRVRFLPLSPDEIDWYVATREPEGKAGGYAIQGRAARFIDRIEGSWSNVVGLPIATVHRLLKTLTVGN
jgi:septum formation protein